MSGLTSAQSTSYAVSKLVADEFLDSYLRWREACEEVRSAYGRWRTCEPPLRGLAFLGYRAALGREERAAGIHSYWTERIRALEH